MNIRKNDTVVVISGNDADSSKTRKVLRVMPAEGKVVVPVMCNLDVGFVFPIPTFPPFFTRIASTPFTFITKSVPSFVPIKFVPAVVPVFPVKDQPEEPNGVHALPL